MSTIQMTIVGTVLAACLFPHSQVAGSSWGDFFKNEQSFRDFLYSADPYGDLPAAASLHSTGSSAPYDDYLDGYNLDTYKPNARQKEADRVNRKPESDDKLFVPSGYQYMSGGAGEGKQHLTPEGALDNKQEVKSDSNLPSYCSPPNPCPKGMTAADGCQENIQDTVEFNKNYIRRQMMDGLCGCDYEHMSESSCPQGQGDDAGDLDISEMDQLLDQILGNDMGLLPEAKNPYISVGEKRMSMTAKKGGQNKIVKRSLKSEGRNPYLEGMRLPVVAKKAPKMN